jgi:hypothetical protein
MSLVRGTLGQRGKLKTMQWVFCLLATLYLVFAAYIGLTALEIAPSYGLGEIDLLYGTAAFVICGLLLLQISLTLKDFES